MTQINGKSFVLFTMTLTLFTFYFYFKFHFNNKIDISYINSIYQDCGQLCDTSRIGKPGPYFDHITADINCEAIFKNDHIDKGHNQAEAPTDFPNQLTTYYSMNGRIPITKWYFNEKFLDNKVWKWSKEMVESNIKLARQGKLPGTYGAKDTNELREGLKHTPGVKNGRVLVIGSVNPWVEACCLEAGALEVVTLEYARIVSSHPSIKTLVPKEFRTRYLDKTLGLFDAVVTYSSVEHSGLGRFGDALNPWGDILAIARGWCVTKENGGLAIGVEYSPNLDSVRFNAGRFYGNVRFPYLVTNWRQVYAGLNGTNGQPVFTFKKILNN